MGVRVAEGGGLNDHADGFLSVQCDPIPTWIALSDAGVQNRQNQIMQNWFRRKELVSPPSDKCGIFAKQHLEFHAGNFIGSEHR